MSEDKNELDIIFKGLEFLSTLNKKETKDAAFTYMASAMYLHHIRNYVKEHPKMKPEIIEALELLINELKSSK